MGRDPEGLLELVGVLAPGFLPRVFLAGTLWLVTTALLWGSPASPVALWRGDLLVSTGRASDAIEAYDAVARSNPLPWVRDEAVQRSANTWAVELGVAREARERLEVLLRTDRPRAEQAALLQRVGELWIAEGNALEGARRLREAHDLAPQAREAPGRLERAAMAASRGGDLAEADRMWRQLGKKHPERLAVAELGRADVALRTGKTQVALGAYERVVDHTFDPDLAAAARFGAAFCLEQLGDLEEALAELDEADLPPAVLDERATLIEARLPDREDP